MKQPLAAAGQCIYIYCCQNAGIVGSIKFFKYLIHCKIPEINMGYTVRSHPCTHLPAEERKKKTKRYYDRGVLNVKTAYGKTHRIKHDACEQNYNLWYIITYTFLYLFGRITKSVTYYYLPNTFSSLIEKEIKISRVMQRIFFSFFSSQKAV